MKAERNHARLYRSSDDVVIAGVCAGVADYLGLPSGKVRLAKLLLVLDGGRKTTKDAVGLMMTKIGG